MAEAGVRGHNHQYPWNNEKPWTTMKHEQPWINHEQPWNMNNHEQTMNHEFAYMSKFIKLNITPNNHE